ncbi:MAG: YebC/PmpR family DNA-binding transcriptional regulator [Deferribacterota bacterium]|nr:YebC/PmpR family DNA-binding transcriptional regulator [Deferribacterota bacterium]
MSGHSKWANIKYKKAVQDAKKGKVFTKIAREITVAVKHGGDDPSANPRLRLALDKAKSVNMPKDNVDRAIKRGSGPSNDINYEDVIYEGYGPGGVALLISTLTDNKNRTVADIRKILSKKGGSLGESGCVAWQFDRKGVIRIEKEAAAEEKVYDLAIEAEALDITTQDDCYEIITEPQDLEKVKDIYIKNNIKIIRAEVTMLPKNYIPIDKEEAKKLFNLISELEELDDVQDVYSNFDVDESVIEELRA